MTDRKMNTPEPWRTAAGELVWGELGLSPIPQDQSSSGRKNGEGGSHSNCRGNESPQANDGVSTTLLQPLPCRLRIGQQLKEATGKVNVGLEVPPLNRFRGLKNYLARLAAQVVLYLGRVITTPQREFNQSLLQLGQFLAQGLEELSLAQVQQVEVLKKALATLEQDLAHTRIAMHDQERRFRMLLAEANSGPTEPVQTGPLPPRLAAEEEHRFDALYLAFEARFRGSREDIRNRLGVYLPLLAEAGAGTEKRPILDVGCGRGEWLELLAAQGLKARGVDLNRVMLAQCRQRGLPVVESDAVAYLQSRPASSLGAVTGFHIIEHLPFPVLIQLLDETVRVLQPGGLAIFETPNPQNILVGSCNFYADPTHRNPLFPDTVKFLAENRGLVNVHVEELTEHRGTTPRIELLSQDQPLAGALNPVLELLRRCFTAGPDFAVVGRKAPFNKTGNGQI